MGETKYSRILSGICSECGQPYERTITYRVSAKKTPTTCGPECAIAKQIATAAASGRVHNRGCKAGRPKMTREEAGKLGGKDRSEAAQARLAAIPQGDLLYLSKSRFDSLGGADIKEHKPLRKLATMILLDAVENVTRKVCEDDIDYRRDVSWAKGGGGTFDVWCDLAGIEPGRVAHKITELARGVTR
jgi:hypothetical protein